LEVPFLGLLLLESAQKVCFYGVLREMVTFPQIKQAVFLCFESAISDILDE